MLYLHDTITYRVRTSIKSCTCHKDSLIEEVLPQEDIGQTDVADITSMGRSKVHRTPQALDGLGGVTTHTPVERCQVKQHPISTVLVGV